MNCVSYFQPLVTCSDSLLLSFTWDLTEQNLALDPAPSLVLAGSQLPLSASAESSRLGTAEKWLVHHVCFGQDRAAN